MALILRRNRQQKQIEVINEELYNFCLHYAENISIREYGSVDHKGFKITYIDTVPTILRMNKETNEVQHNDELTKKGSDFIVFMLLWGFERKFHVVYDDTLGPMISDDTKGMIATDNVVLEFLAPRMKDKKRFLEDFGGVSDQMARGDDFRFKALLETINKKI